MPRPKSTQLSIDVSIDIMMKSKIICYKSLYQSSVIFMILGIVLSFKR